MTGRVWGSLAFRLAILMIVTADLLSGWIVLREGPERPSLVSSPQQVTKEEARGICVPSRRIQQSKLSEGKLLTL
ncbi:MAG: hypothetical protein CMH69_07260 [Nitratireductor sp.]|nr:hypothetical protein [Nitratireductor sp.]